MVDYAFLHGGGQGSWVWDETIAAFNSQAGDRCGRIFALDVPGCGTKRGHDTAKIKLDDIADELLSDLTRAGLKDIVLVGHSQAGNVLPRMVEKNAGLFRRIVYVTCSAPLPGQTVLQMMGNGRSGSIPGEIGWPFDPGQLTDMRERYRIMFCNDMSDGEATRFLDGLRADAWPPHIYAETDWRYEHLSVVPATYIMCLRDNILPVPWQKALATRFKAERLVQIDAGHQAMNTRPHGLAEILRHEA